MLRLLFLLSLVSGHLIITSCKTTRVERPPEQYNAQPVAPQPSSLVFTTEAKLTDIEKSLNNQFQGLVYEDNSLEDNGGDNLMVKAWKQGNIKLSMRDNVISYKVPLKLWIKAGFKVSKFGITVADYREFSGAISLSFSSAVTFDSDWKVVTKTKSNGYEWLEKPVISFAGINIPITYVADAILASNQTTLATMIDESIQDYLNMKPYALTAWKSLNQPMQLSSEYNLWMTVKPSGFSAAPVQASAGVLNLSTGIVATLQTYMGQKPAVGPPGPLPNLDTKKPVDESTKINVTVDIPFDELGLQVNKYFKGQSYTYGKKHITIDSISFYGSNGRMVAEVATSGSLKGKIYFSGIPAYSAADSMLYIRDFDFDLKTRNFLAKSASWVYQSGFRSMLEKYMQYPFGPDIRFYYAQLNQNLKLYRLADGVSLRCNVDGLSVNQILLNPSGVRVFVSASARMKLVFSKLEFKN